MGYAVLGLDMRFLGGKREKIFFVVETLNRINDLAG
jgi:hypothetical protein